MLCPRLAELDRSRPDVGQVWSGLVHCLALSVETRCGQLLTKFDDLSLTPAMVLRMSTTSGPILARHGPNSTKGAPMSAKFTGARAEVGRARPKLALCFQIWNQVDRTREQLTPNPGAEIGRNRGPSSADIAQIWKKSTRYAPKYGLKPTRVAQSRGRPHSAISYPPQNDTNHKCVGRPDQKHRLCGKHRSRSIFGTKSRFIHLGYKQNRTGGVLRICVFVFVLVMGALWGHSPPAPRGKSPPGGPAPLNA